MDVLAAALVSLKGLFLAPAFGSLFLLNYFHPVLSGYECIFGGIVLGYNVAAWISYIFCAIAGGTSSFAIRLSYTFLSILSIYYLYQINKNKQLKSILFYELKTEIWLNVLIGISAIYFWRVFYIHTLYPDKNQALWSGGSTWSDISFHLNIINSYLFGQVLYFLLRTIFFPNFKILIFFQFQFSISC